MAIHIETPTPKKLLAAFKKAIDDGHVTTWSYDSDGDFTHTADQWNKGAWLRPKIMERSELILYILSPKEVTITSTLYAVYHGRIVEPFLRHCDHIFSVIRISSSPEDGDVI